MKQFLILLTFGFLFLPFGAGALTLTVYPDNEPETSSVDGGFKISLADWATIRSTSSATAAYPSEAQSYLSMFRIGANYYSYRITQLFDTSELTASANISSATLTLERFSNLSTQTDTLAIIDTNPASNSNLVPGDYDAGMTLDGPVEYAARKPYSDWGADNATSSFIFSNFGIISKTGITKLMLRNANHDIDNSAANDNQEWIRFKSADAAGGETDAPQLVIEYTLATPSPSPEAWTLDNPYEVFNNLGTEIVYTIILAFIIITLALAFK